MIYILNKTTFSECRGHKTSVGGRKGGSIGLKETDILLCLIKPLL